MERSTPESFRAKLTDALAGKNYTPAQTEFTIGLNEFIRARMQASENGPDDGLTPAFMMAELEKTMAALTLAAIVAHRLKTSPEASGVTVGEAPANA